MLLICSIAQAETATDIPVQEPKQDLPIEVKLTLNINKIFDIKPVDESFTIDAYLAADWIDPRAGAFVQEGDHITLEDSQVDNVRNVIWDPAFEIINITGPKEISNKRIIVYKDGRIFYNERFKAVMSSKMNFRAFPFDSQDLKIIIEPFSYSSSKLRFSEKSRVFPSESDAWPMTEWQVTDRACQVADQPYEYLADSTAEKMFTQFAFTVTVNRIPSYFILQIMLPLIIIMLCAWSIFFVRDNTTQLSLISTLMLTVYAFNFFITDSIPKLPYSTFLGKMIIISFITIFLQLICHLIELNKTKEFTKKQNALLAIFFALSFALANAISWSLSNMDLKSSPAATQINIKKCT